MRIAILGASSQIGRDLVCEVHQNWPEASLNLYARSYETVNAWLLSQKMQNIGQCEPLALFGKHKVDGVINLIGRGDPRQTQALGETIIDISDQYDKQVIAYLEHDPDCRYIFFSSGAVYAGGFEQPVHLDSVVLTEQDCRQSKSWYALAKIRAESRHRAKSELCIFDVRLFSYFSASQDTDASYLMSEVMNSLYLGKPLRTTQRDITRDYIGSSDLFSLIQVLFTKARRNCSLDTYSIKPISKSDLLEFLSSTFGLKLEIIRSHNDAAMPQEKKNYFSINHIANTLGYQPQHDSLRTLGNEINLFLTRAKQNIRNA